MSKVKASMIVSDQGQTDFLFEGELGASELIQRLLMQHGLLQPGAAEREMPAVCLRIDAGVFDAVPTPECPVAFPSQLEIRSTGEKVVHLGHEDAVALLRQLNKVLETRPRHFAKAA